MKIKLLRVYMDRTSLHGESGCDIQRVDHFDLCTTLEISTRNYFEDSTAEHEGLEICWVFGESEHFRKFRGSLSRICRGNVMVFNANEVHTEMCSQSSTIPHLRSLIVSPRFLDTLFEEYSLLGQEMVWKNSVFPLGGRLKECLHQLFLVKEVPGCSRFALDSLLTEIAQVVVTQYEHTQSHQIARLQGQGYFPDVVGRTKRFINENLHDPDLSLGVVAKNVGLSKFHLVRSFKRQVGLTPHAYYRLLRIESAKERLKNTRLSITKIAYGVGFEDLSTFNKAFKIVTGLTPTAFRQRS